MTTTNILLETQVFITDMFTEIFEVIYVGVTRFFSVTLALKLLCTVLASTDTPEEVKSCFK